MPVGTNVEGKMVNAIRRLGADQVFNMDVTADLTIVEEANELIERIQGGKTLPMFTSCCPGWVKFCEHYYPDFLPHLSSCKSPQQMFGAVIKSYYAQKENIDPKDLFVVSVIPCSAKKFEVTREEQFRDGMEDVDVALTTRELGRMIKNAGIVFTDLEDEKFDDPFEIASGAGTIFGATGGVMEAALRTAAAKLDGECKELLLLLAAEASAAEPLIHCSYSPTVPPLTFRMSEERSCSAVMAGDLQQYLYEPDAAILKAGAFKVLCQRYPVSKLAPDTHLYTSGEPVADFPGRRWKVIGSCSFAKSELRRLLADVPAADLTLRGFPGSVAQLRKHLHLREGGSAHFIATTLADGSRHLIRVEREAHPLPLL